LSSLVKDILSAFANDPFRLFSQHERRLCRYAPRPASFPVKSTCTPSGRRTKRTIVRFARMVRHPTQVRWGMCFGCFSGLPDNFKIQCLLRVIFLFQAIGLFFFPAFITTFMLFLGYRFIEIFVINNLDHFLLLFLALFLI
jgi:hypothetical protein